MPRKNNTPLAQNQYINNSPRFFPAFVCLRIQARHVLANMQKINPRIYFSVFARVRIQAPHVFTRHYFPQDFSPACIGFVPEVTPALCICTCQTTRVAIDRSNTLFFFCVDLQMAMMFLQAASSFCKQHKHFRQRAVK